MVIACTEVSVIPECAVFTTDDQRQLGVCFQAHHTVNHLGTSLFKLLRPVDILFFVEAGFQLDDDDDFLAFVGGIDQRFHQSRAHACAVDRLFDDDDVGIFCRRTDEIDDGLE